MTPQEWTALSYRDQKARWPSLSAEEQAAITAGASTPTAKISATDAAAKPLSASCCHAISLVSFLLAPVALFGALAEIVGPIGYYAAPAAVFSAVTWWALGDLVAAADRIARR